MKKNFKDTRTFTIFMFLEFMLTMLGFIVYTIIEKFSSIIFLIQVVLFLSYFYYSFQFKNKMYEEYLKTENKIILNPIIQLKYENLYFYPETFLKQKEYENIKLKIQKYLEKGNSYLIKQESYEFINSRKFNLHLKNLNKIIYDNFKLKAVVIWSNKETVEIVYIKNKIFILK